MSVPLCLIAAALLTDPKWPGKYSAIGSTVVLVALFISLVIQLPRFENDLTIYSSALEVAPHSFLARSYYAESLWSFGHREEGLREFKNVTELSSHSARAHERYGAALAEISRDNDALDEYSEALRWSPDATEFRAFLLSEMAEVELKQSNFSAGVDHLREAIQIAPDTLNYHALLAQALSGQGRAAEASQEMRLEAGIRERAAKEQVSLRYASGL
jgi:tetratricopeptide (TPR) repeat protein